MIIVKLKGGLGNQLFQYALGRRLTHFSKAQLKLDTMWYRSSESRNLSIRHLNTLVDAATEEDLRSFGIVDGKYWRNAFRKAMEDWGPVHRRRRVDERGFGFDPEVLRVSDDAFLDGYWQDERYFLDIEDIIRKEFTPRAPMDEVNERMASEIDGTSSVALHVRRGDYAANPKANEVHGTCSLDYYRKCIDEVALRVHEPHFFVFSDDVAWTKENLDIGHPATYVDHNRRKDDFKDLYLMSRCKHQIIANSTFSWWAAWLNTNKDKVVYAPSRWFKTNEIDASDLIPRRWNKV
jgi:hypothetical protein